MMKKFSRIFLCFILCVVTLGLVACVKTDSFFDSLSVSGSVVGNGGLSVQKGDYLYFVNGFISADDLDDSYSRNASYTLGSLMVAKLDSNGDLILDDDGLLDSTYYRTLSSKLAGYEMTDLYICGDYLYFASPCQEMDSEDKTWANDIVDIYRIPVDASDDPTRIYQSSVSYDSVQFSVYSLGGLTFLLVYEESDDGNTLYRINALNGKTLSTISDITSIYFAKDSTSSGSTQSDSVDTYYANIFFVVKNSDTSKYCLYQYNAITGDQNAFALTQSENTVTVVGVINDRYVYVTVAKSYGNVSYTELRRYSTDGSYVVIMQDTSESDFYITPNGEAVITISSAQMTLWTTDGSSVTKYYITDDGENTTISSIIGFTGGSIVYYTSDSSIKMVSYADTLAGKTASITTLITDDTIEGTYFDLDGSYVYYYKSVGDDSNLYLHRLSVNNNDGSQEDEMVGVYLTADIPETEDEDDEE